MDKKKKIYLIVVGVMLILSIVTLTYALFTSKYTQADTSTVQMGCFNIAFSEGDAINIINDYPIADLAGKKRKGYEFTVTNICETPATFEVYLDVLKSNTLKQDKMKLYVEGAKVIEPTKISSLNSTSSLLGSSYTAYKLFEDTILPGHGTASEELGVAKSYTLKLWIDQYATSSESNHSFSGRISLRATTSKNNVLAQKVLIDNEDNRRSGSIDFSQAANNGIYITQDDQGTTHFFRGNVTNNYVSFAGLLWRIVRINGDGTTRLITDDTVGSSAFNTTDQGHHVGYTYNNSHNCTSDNPCNGTEGTASTMKTYLDNWYNTNLKSYEDKIATSDYCNDTTYRVSGSTRYYGAYDRITSSAVNPVLSCVDTTVNYGGKYNLKIGLLSADEIALSGYSRSSNTTNSYLQKSPSWWSFSPFNSDAYTANVFYAINSYPGYSNTNNSGGVRPVINLKADTLITSGNGTVSNPYVVSD